MHVHGTIQNVGCGIGGSGVVVVKVCQYYSFSLKSVLSYKIHKNSVVISRIYNVAVPLRPYIYNIAVALKVSACKTLYLHGSSFFSVRLSPAEQISIFYITLRFIAT